MAGTSTQSEAYATTEETESVTIIARSTTQAVTRSEQIARYFTEDLIRFVQETGFNLMNYLQIPLDPAYPQSLEEVIEMLYDDISHLIRDGLIVGVNLLISEPEIDPNLQAYPVRYHARYQLEQQMRSLQQAAAQRIGGYLAPPIKVWQSGPCRFALLIDWDISANEKRRKARRPEYCFDWVPERANFDARSLIRYREGSMTMDGVTVVSREESAKAEFQGR